jgi:heat shock protein HslJ
MPVRTVVALVGTLSFAALAACVPTIEGTTWRAVQVHGGAPLSASHITIQLWPSRVTGFAGCNEFTSSMLSIGEGSLTDGKPIDIGTISSDDAVCDEPPGVMQQEATFLADLAAVERLRMEDDRLILEGSEWELHFEQVPLRR